MKLHDQNRIRREAVAKMLRTINDDMAYFCGPKFRGTETDGETRNYVRTWEVTQRLAYYRGLLEEAEGRVELNLV